MADQKKDLRGKVVDQNEETPIYEAAKKAAKGKPKTQKKEDKK